MAGGLQGGRHRLRLQIRATQCKAPFGRTYWSDSGGTGLGGEGWAGGRGWVGGWVGAHARRGGCAAPGQHAPPALCAPPTIAPPPDPPVHHCVPLAVNPPVQPPPPLPCSGARRPRWRSRGGRALPAAAAHGGHPVAARRLPHGRHRQPGAYHPLTPSRLLLLTSCPYPPPSAYPRSAPAPCLTPARPPGAGQRGCAGSLPPPALHAAQHAGRGHPGGWAGGEGGVGGGCGGVLPRVGSMGSTGALRRCAHGTHNT